MNEVGNKPSALENARSDRLSIVIGTVAIGLTTAAAVLTGNIVYNTDQQLEGPTPLPELTIAYSAGLLAIGAKSVYDYKMTQKAREGTQNP